MALSPGTPAAPRPPSSSKTRARIEELEAALALVRADRGRQVVAIEGEIRELQRIYQRMSSDLQSLRAERDHALEQVREEREARARETQELTQRLEGLLRAEESGRTETASAESFVQARLRAAPAEYRRLDPGELPSVPGYRVTGVLGQGGMATVYEGVSERDGTPVAIKLLNEGAAAAPGRVELFLREAAVMLQLSHPGLVHALDAGDCAYGRFLVLELVRGESLAETVRRAGPLPEKEAIRVGVEVARALAYCARVGLTHRDVKPSNLLRDETGRVRVCDFGLAALSYGLDPARPYGSPGYAAPEQISNPSSLDERVDVYSLGATLWHLVVGHRPFDGAPKQVFEQQRAQDLSDPRFEGADVSPRFAQVIRRMARCQRERRYRGWDECLLDLMLVENGNPPFSAHLAEALQPGQGLSGDTPTGPVPLAETGAAPQGGRSPQPKGEPHRASEAGSPADPHAARRLGGIATQGGPAARDGAAPRGTRRTPGDPSQEIPVVTPIPAGGGDAPRAFPARDGDTLDAPPASSASGPGPVLPARPVRRGGAPWAFAGAVALLCGIVGWGLARATAPAAAPSAAAEVEARAVRLATDGDPAAAIAALRAAAAAFDGADRARLLAAADRLEREAR